MLHGPLNTCLLLSLTILMGAAVPVSAQGGPDEGPLTEEDTGIPMPGSGSGSQLPGEDATIPLPGESVTSSEDLSAAPQVGSGSGLQTRGYVENSLSYEYLKEASHEALLNGTRIRLDLSGRPSEHVSFSIGVVGLLFAGAKEFDLVGYFPEDLEQKMVPPDEGSGLPGAADFFKYGLENDIFIQEAFGTLRGSNFRLRVGRQKFYMGTGYAYNPIDLFNYKNPLDPTYEVNGLDCVLGVLDLPHQSELQGLIRFSDRLATSDYLARVKSNVGGWDVAAQYSDVAKRRIDWESVNTSEGISSLVEGAPFDSFERRFRWRLVAAECSGEISEIGINAEGGYVFADAKGDPGNLEHVAQDHARFLVGLDHTWDFELYVMAEYLHLGQGRTGSSEITLNDRVGFFYGDILSTNRNTLFVGASYPVTDLMDLSLYGIVALNDPSAIVNPWLVVDISPGVKLWLTASVPVGEEQSHNGRSGPGGFCRLRFSF